MAEPLDSNRSAWCANQELASDAVASASAACLIRISSIGADELDRSAGPQLVVFDETETVTAVAQHDGAEVLTDNAADPEVLAAAKPADGTTAVRDHPAGLRGRQVVQQARAANPALEIVARVP